MIYFIRDAEKKAIKVGYTSKPAGKRLSLLQTGNPSSLTLIGTMDGSKAEEKALHEQFHNLRINGEWFHAAEELESAIGDLLILGGVVRKVSDELERRQNCRFGLKDVVVAIKGWGLKRFYVRHSYWGKDRKLMLSVNPSPRRLVATKRFEEDEDIKVSAEDCLLLSEWPITCRCWCSNDDTCGA
jgi:hypothetical protein